MFNGVFNLFAKKPTPDELVRKWTKDVRRQQREIDRQLAGIKAEEKKVEQSIKQMAKKDDRASCKILAKGLVNSRKHQEKILMNKVRLNSILLELNHQASYLKVVGSLQQSTQVLKAVNQLMRVPEFQRIMMDFSREMTKAGIIGEMTDEVMSEIVNEDVDEDETEDEINREVDKVVAEVTNGMLGEIGNVPAKSTGNSKVENRPEAEAEEDADSDLDIGLDNMQARLSALRS
ncbi:Snf7-domain-containing protein [Coemansia reversa NRRL 1564]|uniref:Snf7-domain-containing protein n=1 Tax=Coemansia reversa (strain ATCC 12441 / NRRL 1564) TaxID=763665 RepID=A0A2G5B4J4_COERN|nr:Snf7-domain-containing protein [Coemansia reversa NRRL 1564]|eukprot:PIA13911.1 Snf7-domain-containing protein [Coemansia reversa NRRL 1564]